MMASEMRCEKVFSVEDVHVLPIRDAKRILRADADVAQVLLQLEMLRVCSCIRIPGYSRTGRKCIRNGTSRCRLLPFSSFLPPAMDLALI